MAASIITLHPDQFALFTHHNQRQSPHMMLDQVVSNADADGFLPGDASSIIYESQEVYDMLGPCTLTKLETYDVGGTPTIRYKYSTTGVERDDWITIGEQVLNSYGSWKDFGAFTPINNVRYIMRQMVTSQGRQYDIRITTDNHVYERSVVTTPAPRPKVNVASSFGVNGFQWEPIDKHEIFTSVRIFYNVEWISNGDENKYRFSPAYGGASDLKADITEWNNKGITVILCMQNAPEFFTNQAGGQFSKDAKPIEFGDDPYVAANWERYCEVYRQLTIYLGSGSASTSLLKLDTGQPTWDPNVLEANLGFDVILEFWNEADKWWNSASATTLERHWHPVIYAIACNKAREMIKAIDPTMQLWGCGLANTSPQYMKALSFWARANNGNVLPFDGFNFHFYPSNGAYQDDLTGTRGMSPEQYGYYDKLNELMLWRDKYYPGIKFINSEYGYDTSMSNKRSQFAGINEPGRQDIQGWWLLRLIFENWALNIDYSHLYWMADNNGFTSSSTAMFMMSGAIESENNGFTPKKSFYMKQRVSSLVLPKNYYVENYYRTGNTRVLHLKDEIAGTHLFFAWRGTENVAAVVTSQTYSDSVVLGEAVNFGTETNSGTIDQDTEPDNIATITPVVTGGQVTGLTLLINEAPAYLEISEGASASVVAVSITSLTDGQEFIEGNLVGVEATASTTIGTIEDVEFFINDVSVGVDDTSPYVYSTSSLGVGTHEIRVLATDSNGSTEEATVTIIINEAPPEPTPVKNSTRKGFWF